MNSVNTLLARALRKLQETVSQQQTNVRPTSQNSRQTQATIHLELPQRAYALDLYYSAKKDDFTLYCVHREKTWSPFGGAVHALADDEDFIADQGGRGRCVRLI